MPDNTVINNAIIIVILSGLLTGLGAWITARITTTSEKPTDVFIRSLQEARARIAELEKANIEKGLDVQNERNKRRAAVMEKNLYIVRSEKLERLLRQHAPHVRIPEVEGTNGTTPPDDSIK